MTSAHFRARRRDQRPRRGSALVLVLMFTVALAALALSAIWLTSNTTMLGRSLDREQDLHYAAEAALQMGRSRLNNDPTALPPEGYARLISGAEIPGADGSTVPNVRANVWVGPTGSTTTQVGRFASVVAEVNDGRGGRAVRRLEVAQESFARFAYWTDVERSPSGGAIVFGQGDVIFGPVWSNDQITVDQTGATFRDEVATARTILGRTYGTFMGQVRQNQDRMDLPSRSALSRMEGLARPGNLAITAPTTGGPQDVLMRLEFIALDLNNDGDSTDADEGFLRIYEADPKNAGAERRDAVEWVRGDYIDNDRNCGDWHLAPGTTIRRFYPVSVHGENWFRDAFPATSNTHRNNRDDIMSQPGARCFLGGDPHLASEERDAVAGGRYTTADLQRGGDDTTITIRDSKHGKRKAGGDNTGWVLYPGAVPAALTNAANPRVRAFASVWKDYLFPLGKGLNANTKGVIYASGTIGVSGVLRGRMTLYSPNTIVVLDDLTYATNPGGAECGDILGMIAGDNIVVADNALHSPQQRANGTWFSASAGRDQRLDLHAILMALNESFTAENFLGTANGTQTGSFNPCEGRPAGRGCLYLAGGVIQLRRGGVAATYSTGDTRGYIKRYSYDRCALRTPPPYFPTTGRFTDNRYTEIDPVRFDVEKLFAGLNPDR
jgi:hypothetical protein